MKKFIPCRLMLLVLLLVSFTAYFTNAATYTYVGAAGSTDNWQDWRTASNWSSTDGGAQWPGNAAGDVAIINTANAYITGITTSSSTTLSLGGLTITSNVFLSASTSSTTVTITDGLQINSSCTLQSGYSSGYNRQNLILASGSNSTINGAFSYYGSSSVYTVTCSGTLTMGPSGVINEANSCGSAFVLSSGATLKIGSTAGITSSGSTGNIQTDTRTFNTGANYEYNGTAAQATGNGLPTTVNNLTINNSSGVTVTNNNTNVSNMFSILTGSVLHLGSNNAVTQYLQLGGVDQPAGTYGSTASSATYKNSTFFGTTGTGILTVNSMVPVELTSFSANISSGKVFLNWETATEVNNYGFDIERSNDKMNWSKIAFINGHGNSNSPKQYSYTDSKISSDKCYYRLKQIDTDGAFEYSKIVEVSTSLLLDHFIVEQNFPNPFNPSTTIKFGFEEPIDAKVIIYNSLGSEVATLFNDKVEGGKVYSIEFNGSQLASGIYLYEVTGGNFKSVKKMILMK